MKLPLKLIPILILAGFLTSCSEKPEVIYKNARIYTLNSSNDVAEAIAIKEGKIFDIGTSQELEGKYNIEDVVDLKGAVILPGFTDTEGSIIEFSKNLNYIDLSNVKSLAELKGLILSRTANAKGGETIGGYGWNELNFTSTELQLFDKVFLDEIASQFNVFLINATMTTAWVNSRMLSALGIDSTSKAPAGGEIQKYENGEPTGLLFDEAINLVRDNLPRPLRPDMLELVSRGAKEIVKYGITEVHDRTVNDEAIGIFKELIDSNRFPLRVYAVLSGEDSSLTGKYIRKGIEKDYKNKLTIRTISLDYDGAFELKQALLNDNYATEPFTANPYLTDSELERVYQQATENGFQFRVKAVGNKAISNSLGVIQKSGTPERIAERRTMIEHCEFASQVEIAKIGELKIIPSIRPDVNLYSIYIADEIAGQGASSNIGLWNSMIKSAGMITAGSDFPYHQINPFVQIYYLVTRQYPDTSFAKPSNMNEKVSMLEAVKSYTVWPAYASFQESERGSLEKGKYADLIVISHDIFKEPPAKLLETKVLRTMIMGRIVYDNVFDPGKLQ